MRGEIALMGLFVLVVMAAHLWRNSRTIFGRSRRRVNLAVPKLPSLLYYYFHSLAVVENPLTFLGCHLRRASMPGNQVRFRSGIRMKVSDSPDDIATLFCIMVKHDYGRIRSGAVVLDIGANIGAFTMFALDSGASLVHSFEPSEGSFSLLQENVRINGMDKRAVCHRLAVSNRTGDRLLFPKSSDPSNTPVLEGDAPNCTPVFTISLTDIIAQNGIEHVDYLKLDCEGAEYGIILESPPEPWGIIQDVKIEYHRGDFQKLIDRLRQLGFTLQSHRITTPQVGHLWLTRP